jgi:hypothetical protein
MKSRTKRALGLASGAVVVGILVALLAAQAYANRQVEQARVRFEAEAGPLDPLQYAPPAVARLENAATWYLAASHALVLDDADTEILGHAGRIPLVEWDERLRLAVSGVLQRSQPARDLLRQAEGLDSSNYRIDYADTLVVDTSFLLPLLRMSRLPLAEGRLALLEGDQDGALAMARLSARLAASLRRENLLLMMLVANAVENHFLELAHDLVEGTEDPGALQALDEELAHLDSSTLPLKTIFAGNGAGLYAKMTRNLDSEFRFDRRWGSVRRFFWGWTVTLALAAPLDIYSELAAASNLPYAEFVERLERRQMGKGGPVRKIIAAQLIPNYFSAVERYQATLSARQLARLAVELRRGGLDSGAYPVDLSGLAELAAASSYTREAVSYEVRHDGTARLTYPDAIAAWEKNNPQATQIPPQLEWELAPLE